MSSNWDELQRQPFSRLGARERAIGICDRGSFRELLGPEYKMQSPHLLAMGQTPQFDDGVVVGLSRVGRRKVVVVSQEGRFMGGAIGEINGTKMVMAVRLAIRAFDQGERDVAVVISFDTGGVRLQEANAGLLAHAEIMDQFQQAKDRLPIIGLIGGNVGCFGGMGFVAAATDALIIGETSRLGLTGPGVIEEVAGREEFDAANRALVWRTTGARHRYIMRDVDFVVKDAMEPFRTRLIELLGRPFKEIRSLRKIGSPPLVEAQMSLVRQAAEAEIGDSTDLWAAAGNEDPLSVADLPLEKFLADVKRWAPPTT